MDDSTKSWLDIVEYSRHTNKSISTIRRYIKSGKVPHKLSDGKFYIQVTGKTVDKKTEAHAPDVEKIKRENLTLRNRIRAIEEEKADLQMLVYLYEGKAPPSNANTGVDR